MTTFTSVLDTLTGWITHLTTRLVPSLAKGIVYYDGPTAGGSVNANAGRGHDKPLQKYFIPNTLATLPWPRRLNQHCPEVVAESATWIASFNAFNAKGQESFDRYQSGLLGCLAYPTVRKDEREVRNQKDVMMDALRTPHKLRPEGEWIGREIMRQ
ncbi:hypothetical protein AZE42_04481 [Rhizopogon vesiculosus]|uniref:Uncharacterized protein n=1 Tax=Rhizopogon vesiculosus TaxID=180088 RepID=A0A1J8PUR1_9AGAM|nr:hypothetical protein AZE42_04481 [Rhizopogon vesiculosus]